jgi:hypothetical protein
MRRRRRVGARARARIQAGGPTSVHRDALSRAEWAALRARVVLRQGGRCLFCGARRALDAHHVVKRSQGGADDEHANVVALCRPCHDRTDWPYARGRLVVYVLGLDQFTASLVWAADKWEVRARG